MTRSAGRTERLVYDQWRGNFKSKLSRHIGPNDMSYTSMNMQVYESGAIGPRPWLKAGWATTGQSTTTDDRGPATDGATTMAWRPIGALGELWFYEINGDVWYYDVSAETWAESSTGTSGTNPSTHLTFGANGTAQQWGNTDNRSWEDSGKHVGNSEHYMLTPDTWVFNGELIVSEADVVSAISWADLSGEIGSFTVYRDRIFGWSNPVNTPSDPPNRMFYTDAGDYSTATAGNYFDIREANNGGEYHIVGAWPIRDALVICMSDGEWWSLTGDPETGTLRYIGRYPRPAHGAALAVLNNVGYFTLPYGRGIATVTPAGVDVMDQTIRPWVGEKRWTIFHDHRALVSNQEQFLIHPYVRTYDGQFWNSLELVNGSWGWHTYGGAEMNTGVGSNQNMGELRDLAMHPNETFMMFYVYEPDAPGSPATTTHLYSRDIILNRPSRNSDNYSAATEDSAAGDSDVARGIVRLAPFTPPGEEVRVRQVIVDFHYWHDDSTEYASPDMACTLSATSDANNGGQVESIDTFSIASFDSFEDAGVNGDSTIGLAGRWIFRFPLEDQDFRQTYQVQIDQIISLAIDRIIVDYEVRPDNHWAGQQGGT